MNIVLVLGWGADAPSAPPVAPSLLRRSIYWKNSVRSHAPTDRWKHTEQNAQKARVRSHRCMRAQEQKKTPSYFYYTLFFREAVSFKRINREVTWNRVSIREIKSAESKNYPIFYKCHREGPASVKTTKIFALLYFQTIMRFFKKIVGVCFVSFIVPND